MLLEIVRPSCYHQISTEILKRSSQNTYAYMYMHMWDCINGSGFIVADRRRQFITFQFQITHLFSITEVNSSHIIVQTECTFSWKSKWESSRQIFSFFFNHSLPVLHITFKGNLCFLWKEFLHLLLVISVIIFFVMITPQDYQDQQENKDPFNISNDEHYYPKHMGEGKLRPNMSHDLQV